MSAGAQLQRLKPVSSSRSTQPQSMPRPTRRTGSVLAYIFLTFYAVISVFPFVWMVGGAFRTSSQVLTAVSPIPLHPVLGTLTSTWDQLHFQQYLLNSLQVTVVAMLVVMVLYPLLAYALAVLRFRLRGVIYGLFVALLFVPSISVLLPLVLLEHSLGLLNTRVGLSLAYANGSAPLAVLLLVNFFRAVPPELREAAQLDGAKEFGVFWRVYLPLARPAIAAVLIILSVSFWNEYVAASVMLNSSGEFTLPVALQALLAGAFVHWNQVMAGATIICIPVIVVFLVGQRYFFAGLRGAVK
jgi:multiple sugar transport system permease protein